MQSIVSDTLERHYSSRRSYRRRQTMLRRFEIFLILMSLSVALMPLGTRYKDITKIPLYAFGLLFWIGLIGTIIFAVKINTSRKRSPVFKELYGDKTKLGLIHFFQNRFAIISDSVLFLSIIGLIISRITSNNLNIQFILLSILIFSFGMHCMLNGIDYIYIKYSKHEVRRERK